MTFRYILLVFVSLSVFTVFALAREVAVPSSQPSYGAVERSKKEAVEERYFDERNTLSKAEEVATDPFDAFSTTEFRGQTRDQARIPSDPKVAAAQNTLVNELKAFKVLQKEVDPSEDIYTEKNSMNEAVEEQKEEEGAHITQPFNPENWQRAQQKAALLFAP